MKNRQIVFTSPGRAELVEVDFPALEADKILVETEYTLVSAGTERDALLGRPNTAHEFPARLGYCGTGVVRETGGAVRNFTKGDRVLVYHGYHASFCSVREEQLTKVEDHAIPSIEAAFVIIAAMSLGGLRKTRMEIGESVLVMGQGILGILATQLARLGGGIPVIAADIREDRRKLALETGADRAFSPDDPDFAGMVREAAGGKGVNAVIEVTGVSKAMKQALECCAPMARVALLGCTRVSDCPIDYYQLVHKPGVSLIGAHNFVRPKSESYPHHWTNQDDCKTLLRMIGAKRLRIRPLISEIHPPGDAPEVYRRLTSDPFFPLGLVFAWNRG
jgi:2-desacetyl-2-hydroxyethyl bacteriochlorophyllide A dehydrogenase